MGKVVHISKNGHTRRRKVYMKLSPETFNREVFAFVDPYSDARIKLASTHVGRVMLIGIYHAEGKGRQYVGLVEVWNCHEVAQPELPRGTIYAIVGSERYGERIHSPVDNIRLEDGGTVYPLPWGQGELVLSTEQSEMPTVDGSPVEVMHPGIELTQPVAVVHQ